jgi:hypothetical protein
MADELDGVIDSTGMVRRTFMRRLVTGTVFATPVVASFAMAGVEAASAAAHDHYPGPPQLIGNGNGNQPPIGNGNGNQPPIGNGNGGQPCGPQSPIGNPNTTVTVPSGGGGPPFSGFWPPPKGFGRGH